MQIGICRKIHLGAPARGLAWHKLRLRGCFAVAQSNIVCDSGRYHSHAKFAVIY